MPEYRDVRAKITRGLGIWSGAKIWEADYQVFNGTDWQSFASAYDWEHWQMPERLSCMKDRDWRYTRKGIEKKVCQVLKYEKANRHKIVLKQDDYIMECDCPWHYLKDQVWLGQI